MSMTLYGEYKSRVLVPSVSCNLVPSCVVILLPCMLVLYSSAVVYFSIALTISGSLAIEDRHDFVVRKKGLAYYCEGGRGC
jgi:hypothetical protein